MSLVVELAPLLGSQDPETPLLVGTGVKHPLRCFTWSRRGLTAELLGGVTVKSPLWCP